MKIIGLVFIAFAAPQAGHITAKPGRQALNPLNFPLFFFFFLIATETSVQQSAWWRFRSGPGQHRLPPPAIAWPSVQLSVHTDRLHSVNLTQEGGSFLK